jgi:hypothetical protein
MAKIHKDTLLRARKDLRVEGVVIYVGPRSRYFEGVLRAGEILRLEYEPADSVQGVWLVPERYVELEKLFVPKEVRAEKGYNGYALGCSLDKVTDCYDLLKATS